MAHLFVDQIKAGQQFDDVYMVTQPVLRNTTRGDFYIAMFLSDKTGKLNGRMWQATQQIYDSLPTEGFVKIRGKSELYQGAMQVIINDLIVVEPDQVTLSDYMPRTQYNITDMFNQVNAILGEVKNPTVRALLTDFLTDNDLMKLFCTAPAAVQMHHNYLGGLLEHTLSMLNVAKAILPLYPKVQPDIIYAGIFLHDMAKTTELSYKMGFSYTDKGQLVGHIVQCVAMIEGKVKALKANGVEIQDDVISCIEHAILSHHGQYDYGSPKLPATAEAFMISRIDDLDSKMNQVVSTIENEPGDSDWTAWKNPLQTRLYRKRVTDIQPE